MRVAFGVLARYAEVDSEHGLVNLTGGGVDVFGVEHFPVQFMQRFVLQFRFDESEAGRRHHVVMRVLDPQLKPIGEAASFEIAPKLGEYHASGWQGIFRRMRLCRTPAPSRLTAVTRNSPLVAT